MTFVSQESLPSLSHHENTKNQKELGRPIRVAWRTALSRQAVHSKNLENKVWGNEPLSGPSMPLGGFWKFPEIRQNPTQTHNTHCNDPI